MRTPVLSVNNNTTDQILKLCGQKEVEDFETLYDQQVLANSKKIGEGSFSEVFLLSLPGGPSVLKVIPVAGDKEINGDIQTTLNQWKFRSR